MLRARGTFSRLNMTLNRAGHSLAEFPEPALHVGWRLGKHLAHQTLQTLEAVHKELSLGVALPEDAPLIGQEHIQHFLQLTLKDSDTPSHSTSSSRLCVSISVSLWSKATQNDLHQSKEIFKNQSASLLIPVHKQMQQLRLHLQNVTFNKMY